VRANARTCRPNVELDEGDCDLATCLCLGRGGEPFRIRRAHVSWNNTHWTGSDAYSGRSEHRRREDTLIICSATCSATVIQYLVALNLLIIAQGALKCRRRYALHVRLYSERTLAKCQTCQSR